MAEVFAAKRSVAGQRVTSTRPGRILVAHTGFEPGCAGMEIAATPEEEPQHGAKVPVP